MKFHNAFSIALLSAAAMVLTSAAIADEPGEYRSESTYAPKAKIVQKKSVTQIETVNHVVVVRDDGMARSLGEISAIRVGGSVCDTDIAKQLDDHGFVVSSNRDANAVLDIKMNTNGSLSHPHSVEEGTYSARLLGANGRVLFTTSGHEDAHNLASLCEDVGEDIADRLEDRVG